MVSFVTVLAIIATASAREPEAPKIVSWSNTKTANQKTAFQVKPGEKITFTVKADGAEKYLWLVDRSVQKGAGGASFKWAAPGRKGIWKIRAIAVNKPQQQYVTRLAKDFKSFHKRDIPAAIRSLRRSQPTWPVWPEKYRCKDALIRNRKNKKRHLTRRKLLQDRREWESYVPLPVPGYPLLTAWALRL